jgi:hypothetical protein
MRPPDHPFGFSGSDWIELLLAALFVFILWRPWVEYITRRFAQKTVWAMATLAVLPVVLRLALLPHHPIPVPDIYDEFGHLLVADTLRHFRLANPPHPFPRFFETFFVLQQPAYSSIYPLGQGIALAAGWMIFGHPWAGVLLSTAALCSLCYWMLRGWTTPGWALVGGMIAILEFGPLSQWMNSYWGGSFAAAGGCLVFGSLPRLRLSPEFRNAALLGLGFAIHFLTRPYESIFLAMAVITFLVLWLPKANRLRLALAAAAVLLPAIALTLLQNQRITGSWIELPYSLSRYDYGVPAALTFQSDPVPHHELTPQQELEYKSQIAFRGEQKETLTTFLLRLEYRVRFYRFFFLAPLYLALPFFFTSFGDRRMVWVAATLLLFALGINFFPVFQLHYLAGVTSLFVLVSVIGLQRLGRWLPEAPKLLVIVCVCQFVFWYGLHFLETQPFSAALRPYETWDGINHQNAEQRRIVANELAQIPGKILVFVSYWPHHIFQNEWVYNAAAIDSARIVWARDLGQAENAKLRAYYRGRSVWLLEPDASPPKLSPYESGSGVQNTMAY